jgi:acetyl-CoA C-acetyltransferase
MTNAPHMLEKSRAGYKYGTVQVRDHMDYDGLWDAFTDQAMGGLTESANDEDDPQRSFTREQQDAFAVASHQRAAAAQEAGRFADEITPVTISSRKGDVTVEVDEGVRGDSSLESMGKLRPAFRKDGSITAANASQISDGAVAVVVASRAKAEELGLPILAEIGAHAWTAGPDSTLQHQPSQAIRTAAERAGVAADSFDLYEINEAFAAVGLASTADLGVGRPHRAGSGTGAPAPRRRHGCGRAVRRRRTGRRPHPLRAEGVIDDAARFLSRTVRRSRPGR